MRNRILFYSSLHDFKMKNRIDVPYLIFIMGTERTIGMFCN